MIALNGWPFATRLHEMKNTKASEYKLGIGEGLEQAAEMLRAYLVEYPEFVDPKLELEKYKM